MAGNKSTTRRQGAVTDRQALSQDQGVAAFGDLYHRTMDEILPPDRALDGSIDSTAARCLHAVRKLPKASISAIDPILGGRWVREVSEVPLARVLELVAGTDFADGPQIPELLFLRGHDTVLTVGPLTDFAWRYLEARAITLIESLRVDHQEMARELVRRVLPHAGGSIRIGVRNPCRRSAPSSQRNPTGASAVFCRTCDKFNAPTRERNPCDRSAYHIESHTPKVVG